MIALALVTVGTGVGDCVQTIVVGSLKDSSCGNPQPNISFDSWFQLKTNNENRPTDSQFERVIKKCGKRTNVNSRFL